MGHGLYYDGRCKGRAVTHGQEGSAHQQTYCKLHEDVNPNQVTKVVSIGTLVSLCSISGRKRVHILVSYLEQDCRHIVPDFMFSYYTVLHHCHLLYARACTTLKTLWPADS